jgi:hypothetical protein
VRRTEASARAIERASSDPTPEKRPNEEGLPSAEAVEGRTPPKGNGGETAAARTLRRDNASNLPASLHVRALLVQPLDLHP